MASFKLLAILLLLAALAACAKPLPPERATYAGFWRGGSVTLAISRDGQVNYEKVEQSRNGTRSTKINAPIKEFVANGFIVGVGPITTTFVVQVAPHKDGATWKMTVDGVELAMVAATPD